MPWQTAARHLLTRTLLPGSDERGAQALIDGATREELPAGETLLTEGQTHGQGLWFVLEGELCVLVDGSDDPVASVGPGGWVGEVSLLDAGPASATVVTGEPSALLRLDAADLERVRRADPGVALALLDSLSRELVGRIRASDQHLRGVLSSGAAEDEPSFWAAAAARLFGRGGVQ